MKYAQLIIGLLAGTALGGAVVASTGIAPAGKSAAMDTEAVKVIVRQVIMEEPKLIVESVQKMQMDEQKKMMEGANEVLKDPAIREQVFNDPNAASVGPKDTKKVVVEFFDYDCSACKSMFKNVEALMAKDKDVRVVFHEYPIFGEASESNSKIAIAVNRLYADKYFNFHKKMMEGTGRGDSEKTLAIVKELGMDADKIKAEAAKKEVADILDANRILGEKMNIRGTPTFVIGDEIVPHGMSLEDMEARLSATGEPKPEPAAAADAPQVDVPATEAAPAEPAKTE